MEPLLIALWPYTSFACAESAGTDSLLFFCFIDAFFLLFSGSDIIFIIALSVSL